MQTLFAGVVIAVMAVVLASVSTGRQWRPPVALYPVHRAGFGQAVVLPPDALDAIALIREHRLRRFSAGKTLRRRPMIAQRTLEGAYPSLYRKEASDIIDYASGIDRTRCTVVAVRGRMAYARCHAK